MTKQIKIEYDDKEIIFTTLKSTTGVDKFSAYSRELDFQGNKYYQYIDTSKIPFEIAEALVNFVKKIGVE